MQNKETSFLSSVWEKLKAVSKLSLLWSVVLAVGGLVLLAFAASNGFLPELDLTGAVSLLASVSLITLFLLAVFVFTLAGGCLMYSWFGSLEAKLQRKTLASIAMLSAVLFYAALVIYSDAPRVVQIIAVAASIMLALWWFAMGVHRYLVGRAEQPLRQFLRELGLAVGALMVGALFSFNQAMVFTRLYRVAPGTDEMGQWAAFGAWMSFQGVCMALVASRRTPAAILKVSGVLGVVMLASLLILSNNSTFLVDRVARMLGIGALPDVNLAVSRKGCQVLDALSDGALCRSTGDQPVYLIQSVTLRSRFGKEVLIEYTRTQELSGKSEKNVFQAVLPAAEVLGWQRERSASLLN